MSRAQKGGIAGWVGVATSPSMFSLSCHAVGRVSLPAGLPDKEVVGFSSASPFFKTFRIHRMVDRDKGVLVYVLVSSGLINGSPFNSVSVVPTFP